MYYFGGKKVLLNSRHHEYANDDSTHSNGWKFWWIYTL